MDGEGLAWMQAFIGLTLLFGMIPLLIQPCLLPPRATLAEARAPILLTAGLAAVGALLVFNWKHGQISRLGGTNALRERA